MKKANVKFLNQPYERWGGKLYWHRIDIVSNIVTKVRFMSDGPQLRTEH
jgi:hypothetical protein